MFVSNSNVKGNVAELAIAIAAAKLGVPVFAPLTEHSRCDLAIDVGGRLWRIQCKWGRLSPAKDVVIVRTSGSRYTSRGYGWLATTRAKSISSASTAASWTGPSWFRRSWRRRNTRSTCGFTRLAMGSGHVLT
jgi:hypothetical protein